MKIKVMLADDHQSYLDGLKVIFEQVKEIEIVGATRNGIALFDILKSTLVDVVLLDYRMPHMNGFESLRKMSDLYPNTKTIILSGYGEARIIQQMFKSGTSGYILKDAGKDEIIEGIKRVFCNEKFTCAKTREILFRYGINENPNCNPNGSTAKLSKREEQVLRLIGEGKTSKEIAHQLGIVAETVNSHKQKIKRKTQAKSFVDIIKYAIKNGFTDL